MDNKLVDSFYKNFSAKWQLIVISFITIVVQYNILYNQYAIDDYIVYEANSYVKGGVFSLGKLITRPYFEGHIGEEEAKTSDLPGDRWRPLFLAFMGLERELFGYNPFWGHLVSLILLLIINIILYHLFKNYFFANGPPLAPFLATLFFAIMPVHADIVASIKGQDEMFSLIFTLLALIYGFKFGDVGKWHLAFLCCFFYLLSLYTKESALTFFIVIPFGMYFFTSAKPKRYLGLGGFLFGCFALYIASRYMVVGIDFSPSKALYNDPYLLASPVEKYATILRVALYNIELMIWPVKFSWDYQYACFPYITFSHPMAIISIAVFAFLAFLTFYLLPKKHIVSFGIIFYVGSYILVSNLIINLGAYMVERGLFLASVGFVPIFAWLFFKLYDRIKAIGVLKWLLIILLGAFFIRCATVTIERNADWYDSERLVIKDANSFPQNGKLQTFIAEVYIGKAIEARIEQKYFSYDEVASYFYAAQVHYQNAINIYEDDKCSKFALAAIYDVLLFFEPGSNITKADSSLNTFARYGDQHCRANGLIIGLLNQYGNYLLSVDSIEQAKNCFQFATSIDTKDAYPRGMLAYALYKLKDYESALQYIHEASTIDSVNFNYQKLYYECLNKVDSIKNTSGIYIVTKETKELIDSYRKPIKKEEEATTIDLDWNLDDFLIP